MRRHQLPHRSAGQYDPTRLFGIEGHRWRRLRAHKRLHKLWSTSIETRVCAAHLDMCRVGLDDDGPAVRCLAKKPDRIVAPETAQFDHRGVIWKVLHYLRKYDLFLRLVDASAARDQVLH